MYHRIAAALFAALSLCFFSQVASAQVFVPKKGVIPSDLMVELVSPEVLRGSEAKNKEQELKTLVRASYREMGKKDRGPYRAKCIILLQEWELEGAITANFRVECWSDRMAPKGSKGWFVALDTPLEVMAFLATIAKEHIERTHPKPKPEELTPPSIPGEYVRPERTVVT